MRAIVSKLLVVMAATLSSPLYAAYPEKNIQYIIAFVAGGESDIMARWQQTVFRKKYNFCDLVKAAKAEPGKLTFAGSATFSANHVAHEKLNQFADIKTTYVPFKGTGEMIQSIIGKHVTGAMSYVPLALAQKTRMRMLAVALDKRHPAFPEVPTFKELGYKWVDGAYRGVAVPKSTPRDIIKKVSELMAELNKDPDILKWMADGGFEVVDVPFDKSPAFMKELTGGYMRAAKRMGLLK